MQSKKQQLRTVVLIAIMIGSVCTGAVAFAETTASNVNDRAANSASENTNAGQSNAKFGSDSTYREIARGDLIRKPYTIEFGNAPTATIVITNWSTEDGDYHGNITIKDDGDGIAKLHINTWEMGHSNPFEVEGGTIKSWDQIEFANDSKLVNKTKSAEYTTYDLLITKGSNPKSGKITDLAKLRIEEAETEEIQTWTAPRNTELNNASDLWKEQGPFADSRRNFSIEGDRNVSSGDVMLLAPFGGGFYGAAEHAMEVTDNDTAALEWLVDNGYYNVTVTQTNAPEGQRKVLNLDQAVSKDAIDFVNGLYNYHIVIAVETDEPIFQRGGSGEFVAAKSGDNFSVAFDKTKRVDHSFEENEDGEMIDEHSPTVYTNFNVVKPVATLDSQPDSGETNATIAGSTSLAPGTPLTVTVTTDDTTQQKTTLVNKETNEYHEHTWNITADLSEAEDNEDIEITVTAPGYGTIETSVRNDTTTSSPR